LTPHQPTLVGGTCRHRSACYIGQQDISVVFIIIERDIVVNIIVTPPHASTLPKIEFLSLLDENIWNAMLNGWETTRRSKVEYGDITRGVHFAVNDDRWIGSRCPVFLKGYGGAALARGTSPS